MLSRLTTVPFVTSLVLTILTSLQSHVSSQSTCSGTPNLLPIWTEEPTLVNTTKNGIKSTTLPTNFSGGAPLIVLHVYGTDYEMGYAYGSLLKNEITTLIPLVWQYMYDQMNSSFIWIAEPYRDLVMQYGLEFALDLTWSSTQMYTPTATLWASMVQGIADGVGIDMKEIARLCMIPEFIKAQCSIVGAWNNATINGMNHGNLIQLRALDWGTDGPFQMYPLVTTFHPTTGNGVAHTTLSWAGLVGAITGYSSNGIGISEKVWDAYTGTKPITGYAWNFLIQDILRYDMDTDSALSRIATANRTCSIWIGLGDYYNQQFKIVAYSNQLVQIINPRNFVPYPNHNSYGDLLFINKHVQPSTEPCMNDIISKWYGSLDAVTLFQQVTALEQTGNMHIAVYDFSNQLMYVSNASPGDGHGNNVTNAYDQPFIRYNMTELWNMPPPAVVA